jgi:UDP-glucose 4-epimerase
MPTVPKSVLITGGGGFLGGHFASGFASAGWRVDGVGRVSGILPPASFDSFTVAELEDLLTIRKLIDKSGPDTIIHLAAPSSVPESISDPRADFQAQVGPTSALLEAIRLSGPSTRLVLISSAAVYGNPAILPVSEESSLSPISPYGFHKVQQDLLVEQYVKLYSARVCRVRLFSTYGENLRRLAVWEIARRALARNPEVLGTGVETRDYLHAGDIARAVVTIAERSEFRGEAVNVGSGDEVSIATLARTIFALTGFEALPLFTGKIPEGSPTRWRADTSRLRAMGFNPPAWSRGLPDTIDWIRSAVSRPGSSSGPHNVS